MSSHLLSLPRAVAGWVFRRVVTDSRDRENAEALAAQFGRSRWAVAAVLLQLQAGDPPMSRAQAFAALRSYYAKSAERAQ